MESIKCTSQDLAKSLHNLTHSYSSVVSFNRSEMFPAARIASYAEADDFKLKWD